MNKFLVGLCVLVALASGLTFAEDSNTTAHQATTLPNGARYEIVQSTLTARVTFRLDRYTGRVWQLVKTSDDENAWEEMEISKLIQVKASSRPRFQIFTSGMAARYTFLLDTDSGRTWVVTTGSYKDSEDKEVNYNSWQPFAGQ